MAFPGIADIARKGIMSNPGRIHLVLRSVSRPLTILGAERKLFFFAMCVGAGTFNLLGSLRGGLLMFLLLYGLAHWATRTDPQILRLVLVSARFRRQYDPVKFAPITVCRRPLA
jgi:type IV secretory pathway TrbD component